MNRIVGFLVFVCGVLLFAAATMPVQFYMKPRVKRVESLWQKDFHELSRRKDFADFTKKIKRIEITYPDPQVATELEDMTTPFTENNTGTLLLRIQILRWIDENQYGYVVQHEIFDIEEGVEEKIFEFGRTYKVGIFW